MAISRKEIARRYREKNREKLRLSSKKRYSEIKNTEHYRDLVKKYLVERKQKRLLNKKPARKLTSKRQVNELLNYNIRRGNITKPDECQICGSRNGNIHGHHDDYAKPLDVIWCCSKCHSDIHWSRISVIKLLYLSIVIGKAA